MLTRALGVLLVSDPAAISTGEPTRFHPATTERFHSGNDVDDEKFAAERRVAAIRLIGR